MRSQRRLTLRKEALTDLTPADLDAVVGAQQQTYDCPQSATIQCYFTRPVRCQQPDLSAMLADCPL
jgi:hypothetical protein